jgi:orotidine-5'-phosphate decarboxylase
VQKSVPVKLARLLLDITIGCCFDSHPRIDSVIPNSGFRYGLLENAIVNRGASMSPFADTIQKSIAKTGSVLVAGCDPVIDKLPAFLIADAERRATTDTDFVERVLASFGDVFIAAVTGKVAAVKPNIAFFEQYGIAGIAAFSRLCKAMRAAGLPVIADAKRGDIGTTAAAYSAAFLGRSRIAGRVIEGFPADAVTINPFLGFDTLEPFIKDCQEYGKGIFVLVQTSNPGAVAIQGLTAQGKPVREHVAQWLAERAEVLAGSCGWSGLGAVVGASYPEEAKRLRQLMPRNFFLIPGLGAQGAAAKDSVAGFGVLNGEPGGALVNVSRGLLEGTASSAEELLACIAQNADRFNQQLTEALR